MVERLADLPPADTLYDYRVEAGADHVPLWLPYNQGDVFENVQVPGAPKASENDLAMLFMHPCTMREGVRLASHVTVVQVRRKETKKVLAEARHWKSTKVMPLPNLLGDNESSHFADFMVIGTVPSSAIPRDARIAQLSDLGRCHMLHRIIYHLTRHAPTIETIEDSIRRVQKELELQEDWITAGAGEGAAQMTSEDVVPYETAFQSYLDEPWDSDTPVDGDTIRTHLHSEDEAEHAEASAIVAQAIENGRANRR